MGGNVPCVPISALHGTNIDELIETVIVQAEVLQLSGDPKGIKLVGRIYLSKRLSCYPMQIMAKFLPVKSLANF